MALTSVPSSIVAGDSLAVRLTTNEFPAPDWTLKLVISTATPKILTATADGEAHLVTTAGSETENIAPGRHGYSYVWTHTGGERVTRQGGSLLVLPNPLLALPQTWEMQALTRVEAALLKLSGTTNASVDIDGQTYTKRNITELVQLRDRLIAAVEVQLSSYGRPTSRGGPKTIRTRFVS